MRNIIIKFKYYVSLLTPIVFWIYEDEYDEDILYQKLQDFSKTNKTLVSNILNGTIKYNGIDFAKHNTTNNKQYLKEHPQVYQFTKDNVFVKK